MTLKASKSLSLFAAGALALTCVFSQASAGPRLDRIQQEKTLRVGTPGDYRPFAIKAGEGYEGHDVDVINAMAKELGVTITYVPTSWPDLMKDLKADKFDVAIGGITRNVTRLSQANMLPGYAPFGKVALVPAAKKDQFTSVDDLNQPGVRVIKNPGGTNEKFVLEHLQKANVSTHEKNAEIPGLIAKGDGDVMITETYEALHYAREDSRLHAAFIDNPLTPPNTLGFLLPTDDADYQRVMHFVWDLLDDRGQIDAVGKTWLK